MVKPNTILLIGGGLLAFMALRQAPVGEERGVGFGGAPGGGVDLSGIFRGLDILGANQAQLADDQESQSSTFFGLLQQQASDFAESSARQTSLFGNLLGQLESSNSQLNERLFAVENQPTQSVDIGGIIAQILGTLSPAIAGLGFATKLIGDDPLANVDPDAVASAKDSLAAFREAGGTIHVQPELQARFDALEGASAPSESSNDSPPLADLFSGVGFGDFEPDFDPLGIDFGKLLGGMNIPPIGDLIPAPTFNFDFGLDELEGVFNIPNLPESLTLPQIDLDSFNLDDLPVSFKGLELDFNMPEFKTPQFDSPFDFSLPDFPEVGLKTALIGGGAGYLGLRFLPKIVGTVLTGGGNLAPKVLGLIGRRLFTPFILPIPDPRQAFPQFFPPSSGGSEA